MTDLAVLNVDEVAARVGLSRRQVARLVKDGKFPGSRKTGTGLTSTYIIPESAVDTFLQHRQSSSLFRAAGGGSAQDHPSGSET